jgi:hypothetical protein
MGHLPCFKHHLMNPFLEMTSSLDSYLMQLLFSELEEKENMKTTHFWCFQGIFQDLCFLGRAYMLRCFAWPLDSFFSGYSK